MKPTSLRDKLAQLLFVRIGSNMQPPRTVEEDAAAIEALLETCPIGGLIMFNGTPETRYALRHLQQQSQYPLLITMDMERGVGQQIRGETLFPHAMAFDEVNDPEAAVERFARIGAREALANGVHVTFSPVADVNSDPRNPIISTRAFGTDPERVARLVKAYVRGCQKEGLLSTAKHFPGHGNTHQDTHSELPTVDSPREELDRVDLVPFQAAIDAGVELIMTAHIVFPALDPAGRPATLSPPILQKLIREEMGFSGAVISDSLLMAGIRDRYADPGEMAVDVLAAGVDILLDVPDAPHVLNVMEQAVAKGDLSEARVDEAFERVWALKEKMSERFGKAFFSDFIDRDASDDSAQAFAYQVAREAITWPRGKPEAFPELASSGNGVQGATNFTVLLIKPNENHLDPPQQPLGNALQARFPEVNYIEITPSTTLAQREEAQRQALAARHLVVAMIVKPAAWHRFGLRPEQEELVRVLLATRPLLLASLGVPYVLDQFPEATAACCTYSDVAPSQDALAEALADLM
ncbi:MAG: glycoside hydrolase family 3 N-terminal domain-containing protein [Acidiferrobacterales bacterium]|nr:glycoside hydrolase family 3 N-terminal domain-containing protein [Acidiferrobacterales bacterium]